MSYRAVGPAYVGETLTLNVGAENDGNAAAWAENDDHIAGNECCDRAMAVGTCLASWLRPVYWRALWLSGAQRGEFQFYN